MLRRTLVTLAFLAAALVAAPVIAQTAGDDPMSTPSSTGKVPVGGVEIHYEMHGDGPSLVLLHGGVIPSQTFGAPLAAMAKTHRVIAIHLRGHGFSTDSDAPWSDELFADDVAAVLRHLGIGKARFMGYSLGAAVSLQVAIRYPELVEKVVSVSVAFSTAGNYPEVRRPSSRCGQCRRHRPATRRSPFAELYPDADWERIMRKSGEMIRRLRLDSTGSEPSRLRSLLVSPTQTRSGPSTWSFWKLLGGGQRDAGPRRLPAPRRPARDPSQHDALQPDRLAAAHRGRDGLPRAVALSSRATGCCRACGRYRAAVRLDDPAPSTGLSSCPSPARPIRSKCADARRGRSWRAGSGPALPDGCSRAGARAPSIPRASGRRTSSPMPAGR